MRQIDWEFIRARTHLSWNEVFFGHRNNWISILDVIEIARERLLTGQDCPCVVELSESSKREAYRIGELLKQLSESSDERSDEVAEAKWLYLNLAWLFENRDNEIDPLGEVEALYAEFNYPEEVVSFVRYMPVLDGYDPGKHTSEENQSRLIANWCKFLEHKAQLFAYGSLG